jgi:hypothetical protein
MNLRLTTMTAAVALMFFTPIASYAQDIPPAPPGTVAPSAVDTKSDTYTQQKLDQMLAPIALYPDQLCKRNIEMTPLCKIEVTHPRVLGSREMRHGGVVDEQAGVQPS